MREEIEQFTVRARRVLQCSLLEHLRVRELLIQLERKIESGRRSGGPTTRDVRTGLPVERAVHLDRIEMIRVIREFIESVGAGAFGSRLWIEKAVPRPFSGGVI